MVSFSLMQVCYEGGVGHEANYPIYDIPKNKVNCWLLMVIMLMKENVCFDKAYIFLLKN